MVLTREAVRPYLARVTVAPITSTVRGLSIEVPVGPANGLERHSVINCDNIVTIPVADLGRHLGYLRFPEEAALAAAIRVAFDLG